MKHLHFCVCILLFTALLPFLFCACQASDKADPLFPFSAAGWDSTKEEIIALEGAGSTTYDSVYGGVCYTWPKTYENHEGTVKYMLDSEDRLMCVAWTCSPENEEELHALYDRIQEAVYDRYGETSYETDRKSNYGNVWYREEGNIVLSTMVTSSLKALQYAYLNPAVSTVPDK